MQSAWALHISQCCALVCCMAEAAVLFYLHCRTCNWPVLSLHIAARCTVVGAQRRCWFAGVAHTAVLVQLHSVIFLALYSSLLALPFTKWRVRTLALQC